MIERRVTELHEASLLQLWAHEYEVDDGGRTQVRSADGRLEKRAADLVVLRSNLGTALAEMDEVMRSIREDAYHRNIRGTSPLRQGLSEIVSLRNHLAGLVISNELEHSGLMTNPAMRTNLLRNFPNPASERFEMAVVSDVIAELGLGSLNQLSVDQIIESRRYNAHFRRLLDDSMAAVARGLDPVITPQATAHELAQRYRATVAEFARPDVVESVIDEIVWDVAGAALPPSIFLKYGLKALRWRKVAQETRPFLLLMHLERALNQQRHQ